MEKQQEPFDVMVISERYAADLRGRQSVRTTFKLSPHCIDALSLLAGQLGIKQKSIFDHLVDDLSALYALAEEAGSREAAAGNHRVAKTYVISRRTLESLEKASKRFQTPRDMLVESSIERILPLLLEEKRKHGQRKKLLKRLEQLYEVNRQLLTDAAALLGPDDPVHGQVVTMARSVEAGCREIEQIIEKGKKLEEF